MKQRLLAFLMKSRFLSKAVVMTSLKLHNLTYRLTGYFAQTVEGGGLHPKHRLMNYHQWFIEQVDPSWSVLDVGCGNGALTRDLAAHCRKVVGIDLNESNIKKARARNPGVEFTVGDATRTEFQGRFDAVVLSNVLEHVEGRVEFLKKLTRVGTRLLIRVPMIDRDWITLYKKEMGIDYRLDSTHFIEYTEADFRAELAQAGLEAHQPRIRFGEIYAVVTPRQQSGAASPV